MLKFGTPLKMYTYIVKCTPAPLFRFLNMPLFRDDYRRESCSVVSAEVWLQQLACTECAVLY